MYDLNSKLTVARRFDLLETLHSLASPKTAKPCTTSETNSINISNAMHEKPPLTTRSFA